MKTNKRNFDIAVVGASGMVGGELLGLLESRRFPVGRLYAFNSGRKPAAVTFRGKKYACSAPSFEALKKADIVFLSPPTRWRRSSRRAWPRPASGA